MVNVGHATINVLPDMSGFSRKLSRGVKSAVGIGGLGAAFGIGSFIKDSVQLEATYSRTMSQMRVATDSTGDEMERLDDLAIKLGKETVFSANEASSAMLELAKNGISPAVIEAGALQSALTLAAAGGTDLTFAATSMGNAINAFGLKGRQAASVAASLAGAANASSASVESLAQGLQQASASAADSGFNIQETTAALAAFANAGISGSDAGTSLKTMLARLLPTTAKAKGVMKQYGLLTYDAAAAQELLAEVGLKATSSNLADVTEAVQRYLVAQGVATEGTAKLATETENFLTAGGAMRNSFLKANGDFKNLASISGELNEAFADLSDSERAAALNTLFGSDARRAATILTKEGEDGLRKYIKATSDQGAAEKLAKANMEGTAGAMERLSGAWETTRLEFGKAIAPTVEKFLNFLSSKMDELSPKLTEFGVWLDKEGAPALENFAKQAARVAQAFNDMPNWAKKVIVGGGAAAFVGSKLGLGSLAKSGAQSLLARGNSPTRPLYVFNVNEGGGGLGKAGKFGVLGALGTVGAIAITAGTVTLGVGKVLDKSGNASLMGAGSGGSGSAGGIPSGSQNDFFDGLAEDNRKNLETLQIEWDETRNRAADYFQLLQRNKDVQLRFTVGGMDLATQKARDYLAVLLDIRAQHFDFDTPAPGQLPNRTPPTRNPRGVGGGVVVNINGDVRPADSKEFFTDLQNRAHRASSDGIRR